MHPCATVTPARIKELRALVEATSGADATIGSVFHAADTALDELPALLNEVERLRGALEGIAAYEWPQIVGHQVQKHYLEHSGEETETRWPVVRQSASGALESVKRRARQALEGGQ